MIDFAALVLGPCLDTFARPVTVTPLASQPSAAAYAARGVWSSKPVDIPLVDGGVLSSAQPTLGVRLSEFAVPAIAGDRVEVDGVEYDIDDTDEDGQGGSVWTLKAPEP